MLCREKFSKARTHESLECHLRRKSNEARFFSSIFLYPSMEAFTAHLFLAFIGGEEVVVRFVQRIEKNFDRRERRLVQLGLGGGELLVARRERRCSHLAFKNT